jgi:putative FmdB family regulatory protein
MPTYDYECEACGYTFEKFQPITSPAVRKCPHCKKLRVRRLIGTGAGIIFKGSGFYQTDYRSESYKKDAKADRKSGSDSSSGSAAKSSDSKSSESKKSTDKSS